MARVKNTHYSSVAIVKGLQSAKQWAVTNLSYYFPIVATTPQLLDEIEPGYTGTLRTLDQSSAPFSYFVSDIFASMTAISSLTGISFLRASQYAASDIKFVGVDDLHDPTPKLVFGTAWRPGINRRSSPTDFESFVFLNTNDPNFASPVTEKGAGHFRFTATLHEIGHALGLTHVDAWASTLVPDLPGENVLDNNRYTVMSYEYGGLNVKQLLPYGNAVTPMALDIAALQAMYGAPGKHTGNTTYLLTEPGMRALDTYGDDGVVAIGRAFYCIYDTGGIDTIRYDGTRISVLNLNDATLSLTDSASDAAVIDDLKLALGVTQASGELWDDLTKPAYHFGGYFSRLTNWGSTAVSLAAPPVLGGYSIANGGGSKAKAIENVMGGQGGDIIVGNEFGNVLRGRGGDDVVAGGDGDDELIGDDGDDRLVGGRGSDHLSGGAGSDVFFLEGSDMERGETIDGGIGYDTVKITGDVDFSRTVLKNVEQMLFYSNAWSVELNSSLLKKSLGFDHEYGRFDITASIAIHMDTRSVDMDAQWSKWATTNWGFAGEAKSYFIKSSITIDGNDQDNIIVGSDLSDVIYGGAGKDTIRGSAEGAFTQYGDVLLGEEGNDTLVAYHSSSTLDGGIGSDRMIAAGQAFTTFVVDDAKDTIEGWHPSLPDSSTVILKTARVVDFDGQGIGKYIFDRAFDDAMIIYCRDSLFASYGISDEVHLTRGDDKLTIRSQTGGCTVFMNGGADTIAFEPVPHSWYSWDRGPDAEYTLNGLGRDDRVDLSAYRMTGLVAGRQDTFRYPATGNYLFAPGGALSVHQMVGGVDQIVAEYSNRGAGWEIISIAGGQGHALLEITGRSLDRSDFLL